MLVDELLSQLGPLPLVGTSERQTLSPNLLPGAKTRGERVVEDAPPSKTPPPMESDIRCLEVAATSALSSSRTPTKEGSRKGTADAPRDPSERTEMMVHPKDPLEDFFVPPASTPYGEGSYTPSRSFLWVSALGPMLDEIWSEEDFKRLSEEPLQACNREGMRLLSRVRSTEALSFKELTHSFLTVLFVAGFSCQLQLLPEV